MVNYTNILKEYIEGKSTRKLSTKYNISKSTIINNLKKIDGWEKHKQLSKDNIKKYKIKISLHVGTCEYCKSSFESSSLISSLGRSILSMK